MKGLPICFSEVQVKNDVTDNNNKHFVTAFEGECRNIIATTATNNSTCLLILEEICREMTILQQVEVVVIFMPYFRSIATHTVCGYCTNMKLI